MSRRRPVAVSNLTFRPQCGAPVQYGGASEEQNVVVYNGEQVQGLTDKNGLACILDSEVEFHSSCLNSYPGATSLTPFLTAISRIDVLSEFCVMGFELDNI